MLERNIVKTLGEMPLSTLELCRVLDQEISDIKPMLAKLRSDGAVTTNALGQYTASNDDLTNDFKSIVAKMENKKTKKND